MTRDSANEERGFEKRYALEAFKDPKIYILSVIYLGTLCSFYAVSFFLPVIISELGYISPQ